MRLLTLDESTNMKFLNKQINGGKKIRTLIALKGAEDCLERGMREFSRVMKISYILMEVWIAHLTKLSELYA